MTDDAEMASDEITDAEISAMAEEADNFVVLSWSGASASMAVGLDTSSLEEAANLLMDAAANLLSDSGATTPSRRTH